MWRRIVHACVVFALALPLGIAWVAVSAALGLALLANRVWPEADRGNCWTFALVKWWREGGYIAARPAPGVRFIGMGMVPHVLWVRHISGCELQQAVPVKRYHGPWLVFRAWHFKFNVIKTEAAERGDWRNVEKP